MATWEIGDAILNLYEVRGLIGGGGGGQVYRVRHRSWNMDLAVKRPHDHVFTKAYALEDFIREAETWVSLGLYPHVVSCHYVRMVDGVPVVFAEYVDGGTLTNWIADGRLYSGNGPERLRRILDIAIQMAWGLQYAHDCGLVHRDVKPDNVMLTADGVAKITDFGIARLAAHPGMDGRTLGTGQYAAPEQFQATAVLTPAVDVWCWAVSVVQMFVKRPPYMGLVAWQVLETWRTSPVAERQAMPVEVYELLRSCLASDPASRPSTLLGLADHLQTIYATYTGHPYPRQRPGTTHDLADRCNNQGVSLLDLDRAEEAERFLVAALEADPGHLEAAYNLGLLRWRQGRLTDVDLLKDLSNRTRDDARTRILLAGIHLERADVDSADLLRTEFDKVEPTSHLGEWPRHAGCRRVYLLEGHTDFVQAVALGASGQAAASAGNDRIIRLWNLEQGRCYQTLRGHQGTIWALALIPDKQILLSASADHTVRLWNLEQGRLLNVLEEHRSGVRALAVSSQKSLVASGDDAGVVWLWDPLSRTGRRLSATFAPVLGVVLSADGKLLAVGTETELSVWETESLTLLWRLPGARHAVAFLGATATVLSADDDHALRLRASMTGELVRTWLGHSDLCTSLAVSGDDGRVVSAGRDGTARVWEPLEGRCWRSLVEDRGWVYAAAVSYDGSRVVTTSADGKLAVWDFPAGRPQAPPLVSRPRSSERMLDDQKLVNSTLQRAWDAVMCQDWHAAVRAADEARQVEGYARSTECLDLCTELAGKLPRGDFREVWLVRTMKPGGGAVASVLVSPDGTTALTGSFDGALVMWDLLTGTAIRELHPHTAPVVAMGLTAGGRASTSLDSDGNLVGWDLETGETRRVARTSGRSLATAIHIGRIVVGGLDRLTVLDFASGQVVCRIDAACSAVALSPDGRCLASASEDGSIYLWSVDSGERQRALTGPTAAVRTMTFAADGNCLLCGGDDNVIRSFDVRSGRALRVLKGSSKAITSLALTADGHVALTGSKDRQVRLWDMRTGQCIAPLARHEDWVLSVSMTPLGRQVLSAGRDGVLHLSYVDWSVQAKAPEDWDEGARPCLESFLSRYGKVDRQALSPVDYDNLMFELGERGYGWLNPAGVFAVLHEMMERNLSAL